MNREYCFMVSVSARDDAMSGSIEMPIFRAAYSKIAAHTLPDLFAAFLSALNMPENKKISGDILKNVSKAINNEHAMDLEMKRLES